MESYIFRTANGCFGYMQIQDDQENCSFLLNHGKFDFYERFDSKISMAQLQINMPQSDLSWIKSTDVDTILVNVLCWVQGKFDFLPIKDVHKNHSPGEYFPRSIRDAAQLCHYISPPPFSNDDLLSEVRSFSSISSSLVRVFDYIEPEKSNLKTYGNKLREILILACTEVEYLWLKFLQENSYPNKKSYSTMDYIKCLPHLKLSEYEVEFINFPSLGIFKPFSGWNDKQATKSLSWYDAYNAVKHNRGANMFNATLEAAINSIAAIRVLLKAQYGFSELEGVINMPNIDAFKITSNPTWNINEVAMPLLNSSGANWTTPKSIVF